MLFCPVNNLTLMKIPYFYMNHLTITNLIIDNAKFGRSDNFSVSCFFSPLVLPVVQT